MPVSITTARDPFRGTRAGAGSARTELALKVPQVRVLRALYPAYPEDPPLEWPLLTRAGLSARAGYTSLSGTVTRALNGLRERSSSGVAHPGLLALGFVQVIPVDQCGMLEDCYRITPAGIRAYQSHLATRGDRLPALKDAASCTNDRYAR